MKRISFLLISIMLLVSFIALWVWQDSAYPHTIYEYIQSGEVIDRYMDRGAGLEIEAVPLWEPGNPLWVDFARNWGPLSIFFIVLVILYIATKGYGENRKGV